MHAARLLRPLGYEALANALQTLARDPFPASRERRQRHARDVLRDAPAFSVDEVEGTDGEKLLGGVVVRGPFAPIGDLASCVGTPTIRLAPVQFYSRPRMVGSEPARFEQAILRRLCVPDVRDPDRHTHLSDDPIAAIANLYHPKRQKDGHFAVQKGWEHPRQWR